MSDLTMYRGDDRTVLFTFDGASTFESGDVVQFTVKHNHAPGATALVSLSSADAGVTTTGAEARAEIPGSATSSLQYQTRLVYDWQLTTAAGKVRTLDTGTLTVLPDVTN